MTKTTKRQNQTQTESPNIKSETEIDDKDWWGCEDDERRWHATRVKEDAACCLRLQDESRKTGTGHRKDRGSSIFLYHISANAPSYNRQYPCCCCCCCCWSSVEITPHARDISSTARREKRQIYRLPIYSASVRWVRITKNPDCSTRPLTCPFARSLTPLTHLLSPLCSLCLHTSLCLFICSLAHSRPGSWESEP